MQAQRAEWVDAIRYFRGLGKPRRRPEAVITSAGLVILGILTVLAVIAEFG